MQLYKRAFGQEQPSWHLGIFKVRLPFIHYRWELSECLQAILMCATCLGAVPILESVLGVPYEIAWSMVIINGLLYNMHSFLGDPVVPGWITPSIPLVIAFLTLSEQGVDRIHSLIALQIMVAVIFLFMGISGLAQKIINFVPHSIKAGILLGAGMSAIMGEFAPKGRFELYPITVGIGSLFAYFLIFSDKFKTLKKKSNFYKLVGNYGMLPAIILAVIIGPLTKELPAPIFELGSIIKIPDVAGIMRTLSPFGPVGFPHISDFISAIPTAFMVYIIAFGDFVSSDALIKEADEIREDEVIDFNANRSNLVSGLRNLIQAFICPYVPLCGPLWAAVTAAIAERYKQGRNSMDSIFSGVGTFRWMTFICVALVPVASFVKPILPAALSLTLIVQGFVCGRIAMDEISTGTDRGIATVMGAILALKGATWGLVAGILLYIVCVETKKQSKNKIEKVVVEEIIEEA